MGELTQWDDSGWPILEARFPDGPFGKSVMVEYFDRVTKLLDRKEPFGVIVFHDTKSGGMDKDARAYAASCNKERGKEFGTYQQALAIVSSSMVARTALTAIGWISPFPYPTKAFKDRAAALAWVEGRLR